MSTEKKVLVAVFGLVILLVVFLFSSEVVEKEIAPKPRAAWIAVEVADSGLARTGPIDIEGGTPFRLHAVLEAETLSGKTIYYTEAKELTISGEEIPAEALRRWDRNVQLRILWFTVEGFTPYLEIGTESDLAEFRFQDNFRADWPRTWSIPGDLRPRGERALESGSLEGLPRFGTQRYHVRIEIFGPENEIAPQLRLQSLRAEDLPSQAEAMTTVRASLPNRLARPSQVYGLSQLEPDPEVLAGVAGELTQLHRAGLAFSRLLLLRDILEEAGTSYSDLEWAAVELGVDRSWGDAGVTPGDLLRVGNRWVVLLQDLAVEGILDDDDLCLDFDKGARVRHIGEIFTGEGLVEWVRPGQDGQQTGE